MKVACVLLPDFEAAVELIRRPELAGVPVIVGGLPHERKVVRSRSLEAAAYGVVEGMPLRQAVGRCPEAVFLPADEDLYLDTFARILRVLDGFSPKVEIRTEDSPQSSVLVYLDVCGLELLFGADQELGHRMAAAVERETGLHPRVGIGSSKFVARIAAARAAPGAALVVKPGEECSFLAPLPVELIPCSPEAQRRLQLFGLRTMGQLAAMPSGALAEQFGREGAEIQRLAGGIDERPVVAREIPALLEESMEIDPPTDDMGLLLSAASTLMDRLASRLRSDYLACREVVLHLSTSEGPAIQLAATLHEPSDRAGDLLRAVERLLGRLSPHPCPPPQRGRGKISPFPPCGAEGEGDEGGPISSLHLSLSRLGGHHGEQLGLFRSRNDGLKRAQQAIRQAEEQFGKGAIRPLAEIQGEKPPARRLRAAVDAGGSPTELFLEGHWERIRELCNRWRVVADWWRREIRRDYYRLITESGRLCVVYRDLPPLAPLPSEGRGAKVPSPRPAGPWFLERIYG